MIFDRHLDPCPFCGGEADYEYMGTPCTLTRVVCENLKCPVIVYTGWYKSEEEAHDAWNRRA